MPGQELATCPTPKDQVCEGFWVMHAVLPFGSCRSLPSCHMTTDRDFGLQSHGHQIPSHPEADWIAEVIPLHAADRDDGEPLGCCLEDEPGKIQHGKAHVDLAGRADFAHAPEAGTERGEGVAEQARPCDFTRISC